MSVSILGKVFYTPYSDLDYAEKSARKVTISQASAKVTMLAIADNADDFGENSYCSFYTLATKTGLKRRSVIRVCRALINHGYLSVSGLSVYGTNNFKIAMDKLGEIPKKRAKVGRPTKETGDSVTKTGDSVTKTGDSTSPDPSLSVPKPKPWDEKFSNMPLDWLIASGMEIPVELLRELQAKKLATDTFEKALGFGALPWATNPAWEKFYRWVVKIHAEYPTLFQEYAEWRKGPGKYDAMNNKQIRMNPQAFIDTGLPALEAFKMYAEPKEIQQEPPRSIPAAWKKIYDETPS